MYTNPLVENYSLFLWNLQIIRGGECHGDVLERWVY